MKKTSMLNRLLSLVLCLCMVLSMVPGYALPALAEEAEPTCSCSVKCTEGSVNSGCPVCSAEGADLSGVCTGTEETTVVATFNIDAAAMTPEELKAAVDAALAAGYTAITVNLAEDADATMFSAITAALATTVDPSLDQYELVMNYSGTIDLTISGAKTVPECTFYVDEYVNENWRAGAALRSVTLTDATTIGESAFFSCAMTSFSAPNVIEIEGFALEGCMKLTDVYLPSVQTLGDAVFSDCYALKTISLPECIDLGNGVFNSCEALETVYAPKATNLGAIEFMLCTSLMKVTLGSVVSVNQIYESIDNGLFCLANDTKNIELILACDQKALSFDSSTKYWTATEEAFDFGNTNDFMGYTFKSITMAHTPEADDGDCTTALICSACGETVVEAKESHTTEKDENKATCQKKAKCDLCGESYGELGGHSFNSADGKCSVCQNFIAEASVTIDGNITYYATINESIVAVEDCTADDNAVVKMEQSIDLGTTWLEVFGGVFTFDLNGKTLSSTDNSWGTFSLTDYTESRNIHVTITDSGDGGTITHGTFMGISSWGCTLTIEGGTIIGDYCGVAIESSSVVTINGGTISGNEHGVDAVSGSTVTINGGTITGTIYDLYNVGGTFTLGLGENGIGATFPGGLSIGNSRGLEITATLNTILGEGAAYWQDDKMLTVADDATSIEGTVTVKAECKHENATYSEITDTQHKITCSCGYEVTEEHTLLTYSASGNVITGSCSKCPAVGTATITAENTTYKGTAQETATVAYSEGWNSGELTVSYVNNVNAGTATASITVGEATASVEFTIAKAEIDGETLINPEFAEGLIYNGTAQALVTKTGSVDGGYIVYSLSIDGEYTTTIPVATEAGNYRVYWTIECDENHYVDGTPGSSRVTIAKANPEYTVPTGLTATYGDTLAKVELPTGWAWKDAETTSVGNAGTRTFKALYNPDSNNYNTVEADVTVEVAKANPEYTVPTGLTAPYGDTLADVELPAGWTWKDAGTTFVGNAGTRTFKALYNPDSNNYNTVEADVTIEVAKALIDIYTDNLINPEFAENLVYNGTAQALVTNSGSIDGGYIVFSLNPDGEYTTEIPVATEAGEYVVFYRIEGDENHYWEGSSAFEAVTIAKADSSVTTTPAVQELIYNGEVYALVIPGEAKGGTMVYSDLEDGTYGSIPEASAPGIYTVWYKVQGDSNHNDTDPQSLTVTITCDHSFNTNNISGNGDGKHSYICSVCKVEVVEDHAGVTAVFEWPDSYSDYYMEVYVRLNCVCGEEVDYFWVYGDAITVETLPGIDCKNPTVATCTLNYEYNGVTYTDTKTYIVPGDPHAGEFVNGFCSACGGFEEATWNEEDYVYEIYSAGQLYWYAQELNTNNSEIYVKLMKDIVIPENAPNWEPINASYAYFDGNFKTISGLKCIDTDAQYVGLFGMEGWWYEISNLHIDSSYFEGSGYVGAVVACMTNGGSITNCAVTNTTVQGDGASVGTLAGYLSVGSVGNCFVDTNTLVGGYTNGYVTIENSYYLSETETEDGGKTAAQFASGEVAYLLQSAIAGEDLWDEETGEWIGTAEPELVWGQTVGQDAYPVLKGQKVYENLDCAGAVAGYANEIIIPEHSFVQGYCQVCGEPLGDAVLDGVTYVFGGVIPLRWYLNHVEVPTYWVAGDGYVYFDPAAKLLTLDNATVYSELWSSEDSAVYWEDDLVINFSGTNTMSANDHNNGIVISVEGATVMNGIGKDAVLHINSGADEAARFGSLTVNSGSVSFVSKDSAHTSVGVSTVALTVAEGAVVNVTAGNANYEYGLSYGMATEKLHVDGTLNASYGFCVNERECLSCGVLCTELTGSGTINALMLQIDQENMILNFTVRGKAVLASNWKATTDEGFTVTNIFTVAEGAILTIPEGVTLDLTVADFTFAGTVINHGIILLPADFALDDAPRSGTIRIGEKGYIYDSVNGKWYCTEDGHIGGTATCTARAVCETCGASYGELDPANHDKTVSFDDNGFCPNGCYEPAILNADGDYEISNAGQLYWFMEKVNSGDNTINGVLTADIVINRSVLQSDGALNGDGTNFRAWFPIGYWHDCDGDGAIEDVFFCGTFDGQGYTVSGLYFNNQNQVSVGLFGEIDSNATVKNVGVIDSYFNCSGDVGGVVGYNEGGTIMGCYSNAAIISTTQSVGGVVGHNKDGTVENCYNTGSITSTSYEIGGVVGYNLGTVTNCYNTGTVTGSEKVGGVVGNNTETVTNCYNTGTVSGSEKVGGVVGYRESGTITACYNTGAVTGSNYVGGVVGYSDGRVQNCYNTGSVSGSGYYVGGVVGYVDRVILIKNCYYLSGCATDGSGVTQFGVGHEEMGSTKADNPGCVDAKTANQFASGEVAYLLQSGIAEEDIYDEDWNWIGSEQPHVWGQSIGTDSYPVLKGAKVYQVTNCKNETVYSNTDENIEHIPVEDDGDCTTPVNCSVCGDVLIAAKADHDLSYTNNGDDHSYTCSNCNVAATEAHSYTNFLCACGMVSPDAVATVVSGDGAMYFATFADTLSAWTDGTTLQLLQNVEYAETITVTGKRVLDLNGKVINCQLPDHNTWFNLFYNEGDLTIQDSGENGTITLRGTNYACVITSVGNLTIASGHIDGQHFGISCEGGTLNISGGTVSARYAVDLLNTEATVSNGKIQGILIAVDVDDGASLVVTGGEISCSSVAILVGQDTKSAVISGGSLSGTRYGVECYGNVTISGNVVIDAELADFCFSKDFPDARLIIDCPLADGNYTVMMDEPGAFAVAGEGITLNPKAFTADNTNHKIVEDDAGLSMVLCDHSNGIDADGACLDCGKISQFNILVDGVIITTANMSDVLGDGTVSYDPATNTLILNNAQIEDAVYAEGDTIIGLGILAELDLNIRLVGDCFISSGASEYMSVAILSYGNLTFTGNGTLIAQCGQAQETASIAATESLCVDANASVTVSGLALCGSYSIPGQFNGILTVGFGPYDYVACGNAVLSGDLTVNGNNDTATMEHIGEFTVMEGATLTIADGVTLTIADNSELASTEVNNIFTNKGKVILEGSGTIVNLGEGICTETATHCFDSESKCLICGYTCPHSWLDATCTAPKTCTVCGETEGEALGHSYENDVCTVCGHIGVPVKLDSASLSFKEKIHYNIFFYLGIDETVDLSDIGLIMFDSLNAEGTMDDAIAVYSGAVEMDGKYMVATDGIHAKYMGDTIYFRVYAKLADGSYVYSKTVEYSAVTYAEHIFNSDKPESAKALVVAMLNYGAAAQMFFGYNTDNLVNTFLTDEQKALPEQYRDDMANTVPVVAAEKQGIFANNKGFNKRTPAVSFEGAFEINYFFTPAYTPVDGITLYYWTEADFEANEVLTVDNATGSLKLEGTGTEQYRGDIGGIAAKNLSENIYVAAVYSDGTTTWTSGVLGYSIGAYCGRLATNGGTIADLAMATAVYGYHAKAYFG